MDYLKNLHKALKLAKQLKVIEDSFNNPSSSVSTASASANITISTPSGAMTKYQSYSTTPFSVSNHLICKIDKNRIQPVLNRFNIKNSYDTTFTEYTNSNQNNKYCNSSSKSHTTIERTTSATRLIRALKNILTIVNKLKYKYVKAIKLGICRCKCCKLIGNNKTRNAKKKYCCYTCKHITKIISKTIDKSLEKCNNTRIITGKQYNCAVQESNSSTNNSNDENLQNISPNSVSKDFNKTDHPPVNANCNDELPETNIVQEVNVEINMPKSGVHQEVNSMLSPKNKETKDNTKENNEMEVIQSQEITDEKELETVKTILKQINENIIKPVRPTKDKPEKMKSSQQNNMKSTNENQGWIKLNSAIEQTNIIKSQKTDEGFLKPTSQPLKSKRAKINNDILKINVSQTNPTQENDEQKMHDICKRVELWKQYGTPWLNDFADLYEPHSYTEPNGELIFEASSISESYRNKPKENNNYVHQSSQTVWQSPDLSPIPIYKRNKKLNK